MLRSLLPSRTSLADFSVKPAARRRSRSNEKSPGCSGRKGPVTGKAARMDLICVCWARILLLDHRLGKPLVGDSNRTDSGITRPSAPRSCSDALFEIHRQYHRAPRLRSPEPQESLLTSRTPGWWVRQSSHPATAALREARAKSE